MKPDYQTFLTISVIEHGQRTEDLLENGLSGFAVEVQKINRIFQITVSIFNTPS